jgi:predicted phosphodiesterase
MSKGAEDDPLLNALNSPPASSVPGLEKGEAPEFIHWFGNDGKAAVVVKEPMDRDGILKMFGWDPQEFRILEPMEETHWTMGHFTNHRYKFRTQRINSEGEFEDEFPKWPVIQPAAPIVIKPSKISKTPKASKWKTAIVGSDTQFGYRFLEDDTAEEFHDEKAISVFHQIVAIENPDQMIIAGDIGDFAAQGSFIQENGFARNTQPTIDRMGLFAAQLRADTDGKIVWIEGNHDKRLQKFVEINSASALGLKKANWPDSYPVMSIPNLCRLDDFDIIYKDAYPAAHWWINDKLRAEHGDRSNSNGATADKYARETPHISRVFGHSHRLEKISRTTYDRQGRISSKFINTGCLCRTDGTVPSTHGAKGADGRSATVYENWQNGLALFRYRDDGDFFVELIEIENGMTFYSGGEVRSLV